MNFSSLARKFKLKYEISRHFELYSFKLTRFHYTQSFEVVSFILVLQPQFCLQFLFLLHVLYDLFISFLLI
jgi:hypothetical protein